MLVVADTGPLISLIHIKQLGILTTLYPDYVIAESVYRELARYKKIEGHSADMASISKHIKSVQSPILDSLNQLGIGEAESIVLIKELKADAFLTDDMEARRVAESMNIHCFGTLALLLQAKSSGLINTLKPLLDELLTHKRYYSKDLIQLVLKYAGEL